MYLARQLVEGADPDAVYTRAVVAGPEIGALFWVDAPLADPVVMRTPIPNGPSIGVRAFRQRRLVLPPHRRYG